MKGYEFAESSRRLMPLLPVLARVDGRAFRSFTRGMAVPYDERMSEAMAGTAMLLAKETNASMVYTQSDEISLAWHSLDAKREIFFGGRVAKMTSQLASMATLFFYKIVLETMPEFAGRNPTFDARVWQVPNRAEGANVFLWRELDATKNSVSMAAGAYYSAKQLHGKHSGEKQEMLWQAGVNWNDYPAFFKRGVFIQRRTVSTPFEACELEALPPKHHARLNPNLTVERRVFSVLEMPPFGTVTNREEVVFEGASPSVAATERELMEDLRGSDPPTCPSCGVPDIDHPGLYSTCRKLQLSRSALMLMELHGGKHTTGHLREVGVSATAVLKETE